MQKFWWEYDQYVFVDQIEYSRAMMSSSMDKAVYVWTEINKSEEEVANTLTDEEAETHGHADSVTFVELIYCCISHELSV